MLNSDHAIKLLRTKEYASLLGTNTLTELIVDAYQRKMPTPLKEMVSIRIDLRGDDFVVKNVGKNTQAVNAKISIDVKDQTLPIILNGSGDGVIGAINDALKKGIILTDEEYSIDDLTANYKTETNYLDAKKDLVSNLVGDVEPGFTFEDPNDTNNP